MSKEIMTTELYIKLKEEEIAALRAQLAEAEAVIAFYGSEPTARTYLAKYKTK